MENRYSVSTHFIYIIFSKKNRPLNSEIFPDSPRFCIPTDYTQELALSVSDQEPWARGDWVIRPASFAGPVVMPNILPHGLHHYISAHIWRETLEIPSQRTGNLRHLAPNKPSSYFLLVQGPGLGRRLAEVQVQMLQRPISPSSYSQPFYEPRSSTGVKGSLHLQRWRICPIKCLCEAWGELAARLLVAFQWAPRLPFLA